MIGASSFTDAKSQSFREEIRNWIATTRPAEWDSGLSQAVAHDEAIRRRREWDRMIYDAGYAGLTWPTEYGGRGLGLIEEFIFFQEVARSGAPDLLNFIGFDLAGPAILTYGTDEQKAEFLPRILTGRDLWCEGFSEPDAGSDLANVSTKASWDESSDSWVVSGQKIWTSHAQIADRCYLLVKSADNMPKRHNLSVLLLDMRQPGIEVRPIRQITDDYEFNELFLTEVRVPRNCLLGEENEGWQLGALAGFRGDRRVFDALRRLVQMGRMASQLAACARSRSERAAAERLVEEVSLVELHVMRCSEQIVHGRESGRSGSIMRLAWSLLWQRIVAAGLDTGCREHEAFWRHQYLYARSLTIAGGTAQIQRNIIAQRVLDLPR